MQIIRIKFLTVRKRSYKEGKEEDCNPEWTLWQGSESEIAVCTDGHTHTEIYIDVEITVDVCISQLVLSTEKT